ncbi:MAG: hypothetical protein WC504_08430 [Methylobacter sp.]
MKIYPIGVASILLSACTTVSYDLHPKSHYDYPNSNIKPLGEVVGKADRQISFMLPTLANGEMERQAIENALKTKSGADILINYIAETKTTIFPYIFILDYTVHGTAASMSIDKQKLK